MGIAVTSGVLATLCEEAKRAAPAECCGLLLGRDECISQARPAANVSPEPLTHFEIDPVCLLSAHKAAREGGLEVIGYYHSHPEGHPVPSATDCEHASGDGRVWAIVAAGEVTFWRDAVGQFMQLAVAVAATDP